MDAENVNERKRVKSNPNDFLVYPSAIPSTSSTLSNHLVSHTDFFFIKIRFNVLL